MQSSSITFRLLAEADIEQIHQWLNEEHVAESYGEGKYPEYEQVAKKFGDKIEESKIHCYIIEYDSQPIGFIQTYLLSDYPEYQQEIDMHEEAASLDLFIGNPNYIGKGLGSMIIKKFVKEVIFTTFNVSACIVGPNVKNKASIHAFEKVGFEYFKTAKLKDGTEEYLLKISNDKL